MIRKTAGWTTVGVGSSNSNDAQGGRVHIGRLTRVCPDLLSRWRVARFVGESLRAVSPRQCTSLHCSNWPAVTAALRRIGFFGCAITIGRLASVLRSSLRGWFYRRMTGGTGSTQPTGLRENGMSWSWKSRTATFLKTVDDSGFWTLPDGAPSLKGVCRSHWILEGVRGGQYRVIDRCSPAEDDPIRIIGIRAMRLASLRVHGRNIY